MATAVRVIRKAMNVFLEGAKEGLVPLQVRLHPLPVLCKAAMLEVQALVITPRGMLFKATKVNRMARAKNEDDTKHTEIKNARTTLATTPIPA